ncbi:hypothetical protein GF314_12585 [bacterium]|nr:hypothetical protein [bacterium]
MRVAIRCRSCADGRIATVLLAGLVIAMSAVAGRPPLRDGPVVWYEDDRRPIPVPDQYDPLPISSEIRATVSRPIGRALDPVRWLTGADGPAWNPNALGEVPGSTWFTNRMGLRRLTAEELATGPGREGPSRDGPWEIIGAKQGGVTMGFRIRDAAGQVWLLKFDPPEHPGQSIRAGVVSNLILHACGYNTPVDRVVVFDRDQLSLGVDASLRTVRGTGEVRLTEANLDSVLQATDSVFDGRYHALASRFLDGIPLGPIRHQGTRPDDPNDHVPHEHRREWRGLRVICAWIGHNDTKIQNTLAMYEGEPGAGHVAHYLLDFASSLGTSGAETFAKFNFEYGVDLPASLGRLATLGLRRDVWQTMPWPTHLDEVAHFHSLHFDPRSWSPIYPNSAFANLTTEDGYWAAKIVSAFTDRDLRIMVEQGRYQDPRAVDWLVEHLGRRRDIIARTWFDEVAPLDFWTWDGAALSGHDLGLERGLYPVEETRYRARARLVDERREGGAWSDWRALEGPVWSPDRAFDRTAGRFLAVQFQVDRGRGWQDPITVYVGPRSGRVVAVDR